MFGNENDVDRCLRMNVAKGKTRFILVDLVGGPFATENLVKDSRCVVRCLQGSSLLCLGHFIIGRRHGSSSEMIVMMIGWNQGSRSKEGSNATRFGCQGAGSSSDTHSQEAMRKCCNSARKNGT